MIGANAELLRAGLAATKDLVRTAHDSCLAPVLSTVMGPNFQAGKHTQRQRERLLRQDQQLTAALQGAADVDGAITRIAHVVKIFYDSKSAAIKTAVTDAVTDHLNNHVVLVADKAADAVDKCFKHLKQVTSEALAADISMTPDRVHSIQQYGEDTAVVEDAITTIKSLEDKINEVAQQLDSLYDPNDVLATANDEDREKLAKLRKSLEEQRTYTERQMLEHFDNTARLRATDSKVLSSDLIIPAELEKGKGLELVINVDAHMEGKTAQFWAIRAAIRRASTDYNPVTGLYWKPPTLTTGYTDVPQAFREAYQEQSLSYFNLFIQKMGRARINKALYTHKIGINKQVDNRCDEGDGVSLYYALLSMNRPSQSTHREVLVNKIEAAPEHFRRGDPLIKVAKLQESLSEAIKQKIRLKWLTGQKIISVLSARHNSFAVRLEPLRHVTNPDDAADHLDSLMSEITDCCNDIQLSQGDTWFNAAAHANAVYSNSSQWPPNFNGQQAPACRYGKDCTRKDCRFSHPPGHKQNGDSVQVCHHKPCKQKASGKDKRFCTTCFKKGLEKGSLPMKDGSTFKFKRAQKARAKSAKKNNPKDKSQKSDEVFNGDQMEVLQAMHAMQIDSQQQSVFDVAANGLPPGPQAAKRKNIMERLGSKAEPKMNKVQNAVLAITASQE